MQMGPMPGPVLRAVALGGALGFVALLLLDHAVRRDVVPVDQPISDYGRGRMAWLFSLSLFFLAASKASVATWLARSARPAPRVAAALLFLDAVATIMVALFPTDVGTEHSWSGAVHASSATVAFLAGTAALLVASWSSAAPRAGHAPRVIALLSAVVLIAFAAALVGSRFVGLTERAHATATALWLAVVAWTWMA